MSTIPSPGQKEGGGPAPHSMRSRPVSSRRQRYRCFTFRVSRSGIEPDCTMATGLQPAEHTSAPYDSRVSRGGLEPPRTRHQPLRLACLPFHHLDRDLGSHPGKARSVYRWLPHRSAQRSAQRPFTYDVKEQGARNNKAPPEWDSGGALLASEQGLKPTRTPPGPESSKAKGWNRMRGARRGSWQQASPMTGWRQKENAEFLG